MIKAIKRLYLAFPHLASRELHLGTEAFGGRLVPSVATTILQHNDWLPAAANESSIRLKSIIPGSSVMHPAVQLPGLYETACAEQDDSIHGLRHSWDRIKGVAHHPNASPPLLVPSIRLRQPNGLGELSLERSAKVMSN